MLENLHVTRTIHRLDGENPVILGLRDEHVLAIPAPVSRRFPKGLVEDLWRIDLLVSVLLQAPAHVADQVLHHAPALRVPEDDPRTLFLEMKQVHFPA